MPTKKRRNFVQKYFCRFSASFLSLKHPKGINESVHAVLGPATKALPIIATGFPSDNRPAPPFPFEVNIL